MADQTLNEETIQKVLHKCMESTTVHGLVNIKKNLNLAENRLMFFKLMWVLLLVGSFALCSYLVVQTTMRYLDFDVTTSVRILAEMPLSMPQVTICAANPFTTLYSKQYLDKILLRNGFDLSKGAANLYQYTYINKDMKQKIEYMLFLAMTNVMFTLSESEKVKLGYKLEDILLSCSIGPKSCTHADLRTFYNLNHGQCFSFINTSSTFLARGGKINGMKLEFLLNYESSSLNSPKLNGYNLDLANGLRIWTTSAYADISYQASVDVSPAVMSNIMIKKTSVLQLPQSYSNCKAVEANVNYSQNTCLFNCYLIKLKQVCNCTFARDPSVGPCLTYPQKMCHFENYENYVLNVSSDNQCTSTCLPMCERTYYEFVSSYLDYPSMDYLKVLIGSPTVLSKLPNASFVTPESLKKSLLAVNIYFENFDYKQIEEIPNMSFVDFVSDFGGLLGLFVGYVYFISVFKYFRINLYSIVFCLKSELHEFCRVL
jgi:hypothetical protein